MNCSARPTVHHSFLASDPPTRPAPASYEPDDRGRSIATTDVGSIVSIDGTLNQFRAAGAYLAVGAELVVAVRINPPRRALPFARLDSGPRSVTIRGTVTDIYSSTLPGQARLVMRRAGKTKGAKGSDRFTVYLRGDIRVLRALLAEHCVGEVRR